VRELQSNSSNPTRTEVKEIEVRTGQEVHFEPLKAPFSFPR
jgi:hypothetical protein